MSSRSLSSILNSKVDSLLRDFRSREHSYLMVLAVLLGVLGGLGNLFFQFLIDLFRHFAWGGADSFVGRFGAAPIWLRIVVPVFAGFFGGLIIHYFAPEAKGHGVPEVMKAVALQGGRLRRRTVLGKTVASALTLGAGGSVGREGPIVQIGSALGSTVGQLLKLNSARMRTLVACGATAGIAATFNAPIAGAFFSAEVILGDFGVAQYAPLVASAVVATLVSHLVVGNDPAFLVPEGLSLSDGRELLLYAVLGLAASLVAVGFMKVLHKAEDIFDDMPIWVPFKTALGGLGFGLIGVFLPHTLGNGYEGIAAAMNGEIVIGALALLLVVKVVVTSITLGSGNSGGIFAPSLFMGVMFGGFMGTLFHSWFPAWTADPGAYALVGMGAVVAAAIHAPITAIIMIFEMTRDYGLILPLMIAVVFATLMSQRLQHHSIYTFKLARQGIDLLAGKDFNILRRIKVRQIMHEHFDAIDRSSSLVKVVTQLAESSHHESLILDAEGRLTGILTLDAVKRALPQLESLGNVLIAQDLAMEAPLVVHPDDDLDFAMRQFERSNTEELPVVRPEAPDKPIGTLVRHELIKAYNQAIAEDDLTASAAGRMEASLGRRMTETLGGFVLLQAEVPAEMQGRTLAELEFRRKYNSQVLLVSRGDEGENGNYALPERDTRLEAGDRILVFGPRSDVARIRNL